MKSFSTSLVRRLRLSHTFQNDFFAISTFLNIKDIKVKRDMLNEARFGSLPQPEEAGIPSLRLSGMTRRIWKQGALRDPPLHSLHR
jgi:hypothetical protein